MEFLRAFNIFPFSSGYKVLHAGGALNKVVFK